VSRPVPVRYRAMNKVVLVTGGSRGIGAATSLLAARHGYWVCVNYHQNREAAERVVNDIEATGARAVAVAGDVAIEADVVRLFETCGDTLGAPVGLVNNAGVLETQSRTTTESFVDFRPRRSVNTGRQVAPFH
jgi:NAD(P)-dependent dehydrogenase (short-subunit alcohol dehydrogenase family)